MPRNRWASVATTRFAVILEWNRMLTMHISSWIVRTAAFTTSITLPQKTTLKRFCIAFDQLSVSSNFTAKWLLNSWIPLFAVACFFLFHFFVLLFCGYQYNGDGLFTLNGAVKSFFIIIHSVLFLSFFVLFVRSTYNNECVYVFLFRNYLRDYIYIELFGMWCVSVWAIQTIWHLYYIEYIFF